MNKFNYGVLDDTGGGFGMLTETPQQPQPANPYAEQQRQDPNRNLWAGTAMDIGAIFGNAFAGTGQSTGNAMRMYQGAKQHNQYLDQAGQQWEQQQVQAKRDAEDRKLKARLTESQIGKNQASAASDANPRPKPIGSPQRLADGSLAQTVQNPDGSITMEPLGQFANEGRVVTVAGVPYFLDDRSNQLMDLGQGMGGGAPAASPAPTAGQPAAPGQAPSFTPESVAGQEASREAAIAKARDEAKRETERELKMPEWRQQLADTETQIANIADLRKNIGEVGFGMIEGRITGGMPIVGSQYDDLFDSIASSQVLKNAQQMTGVLSESDIALIRSMGLDRTRGREFNERQINQLMDVYSRAATALREKVGVSDPNDDDLINKYLD